MGASQEGVLDLIPRHGWQERALGMAQQCFRSKQLWARYFFIFLRDSGCGLHDYRMDRTWKEADDFPDALISSLCTIQL